MLVCAVLAMAASPPLTLDPPRTTRPIMANDVFREAMRQLPKMLASHGLEPSGQLLPGTMLPLVRPLKRRAARTGVEAADDERSGSPLLDAMAGIHVPDAEPGEEEQLHATQPTLDELERLALGVKSSQAPT
jgi:hypothetical protein